MKFVLILITGLLLPAGLAAQNIRVNTGTSLPASCTEGDEFTKTDAAVGQKKYSCIVTDTWEQQGGVNSSRTINTTTPLTGGADLSVDRTFSCPTCEVTGNKNATNGYAGLDASSKLAPSQIPSPSSSSLGGVQSATATSHQWIDSISTLGVPHLSQPAAADISGLAASATTDTTNAANISSGILPAARLPNPSASTLGGIESLAATSHQWINTISTSGVPSSTQPAIADLSDAASIVQTSRSISTSAPLAGGGDLSANRTFSITGAAGQILAGSGPAFTATPTLANSAAPSSPSSGNVTLYTDSTDLRLHDKNASGTVGTTVVADSGASNNFLTAISAAGAISKTQPAFSNLSGSATCAQLPALTGHVTTSAGSCATTAGSIVTAFTSFCTGSSIASSSTLFMPGYGGVTTTCTGLGTTRTSGIPVSAGTIKNLRVNMGTAGKAGDKVTVEIAGVASALTCTYGTGTSCSDTTHTASVTAGQVLTIAVVTGSSDTTANLNVYFELVN